LSRWPAQNNQKCWIGKDAAICAWFDEDGKVIYHALFDVARDYDSALDWFLVIIGLKDRKPRIEIEVALSEKKPQRVAEF
jgi:hypothetical protein